MMTNPATQQLPVLLEGAKTQIVIPLKADDDGNKSQKQQ